MRRIKHRKKNPDNRAITFNLIKGKYPDDEIWVFLSKFSPRRRAEFIRSILFEVITCKKDTKILPEEKRKEPETNKIKIGRDFGFQVGRKK